MNDIDEEYKEIVRDDAISSNSNDDYLKALSKDKKQNVVPNNQLPAKYRKSGKL